MAWRTETRRLRDLKREARRSLSLFDNDRADMSDWWIPDDATCWRVDVYCPACDASWKREDLPRTCTCGAKLTFRCPWVYCRYHLLLERRPSGAIVLLHPELDDPEDPTSITHTCAQELAIKGELTLAEIGKIENVTRERVRQIELKAKGKLREKIRKAHSRGSLIDCAEDTEDGVSDDELERIASMGLTVDWEDEHAPLTDRIEALLHSRGSVRFKELAELLGITSGTLGGSLNQHASGRFKSIGRGVWAIARPGARRLITGALAGGPASVDRVGAITGLSRPQIFISVKKGLQGVVDVLPDGMLALTPNEDEQEAA